MSSRQLEHVCQLPRAQRAVVLMTCESMQSSQRRWRVCVGTHVVRGMLMLTAQCAALHMRRCASGPHASASRRRRCEQRARTGPRISVSPRTRPGFSCRSFSTPSCANAGFILLDGARGLRVSVREADAARARCFHATASALCMARAAGLLHEEAAAGPVPPSRGTPTNRPCTTACMTRKPHTGQARSPRGAAHKA